MACMLFQIEYMIIVSDFVDCCMYVQYRDLYYSMVD